MFFFQVFFQFLKYPATSYSNTDNILQQNSSFQQKTNAFFFFLFLIILHFLQQTILKKISFLKNGSLPS